MKTAPDELVMRFLDGELTGPAEREALLRIAEDPDARALLRLDAGLRGAFGGRPAGLGVPAGFTDRVMAAVEARHGPSEARAREAGDAAAGAAAAGGGPERGGDGLTRLLDGLTRPRTLTWRPAQALAGLAVAAAVALLLVVGPGSFDPTGGAPAGVPTAAGDAAGEASLAASSGAADRRDTVLVRFVFASDEAESVAVAGDFSRWEPIPLSLRRHDGRPVWSGLVAVPRGEHRYMFVVDGTEWVTDPLATAVRDDGFGNHNAILSL